MKKFVFLFVSIVTVQVFADSTDTNIQWIGANICHILDSLNIKQYGVTAITISIPQADQLEKDYRDQFLFLKNTMVRYFSDEQLIPGLAGKQVVFQIEQFETRIVYAQKSDGFLGLQEKLRRTNIIRLSGWLENATTGSQLLAVNVSRLFKSDIMPAMKDDVEKSPFSFTKGEIKELSTWTKIVEPIITLVSVSTVVYLFFTVRS